MGRCWCWRSSRRRCWSSAAAGSRSRCARGSWRRWSAPRAGAASSGGFRSTGNGCAPRCAISCCTARRRRGSRRCSGAARIAVGLKIVSLWRKKVDIEYAEVERPQLYLIVYPDGRTNIPAPKTPRRGKRGARAHCGPGGAALRSARRHVRGGGAAEDTVPSRGATWRQLDYSLDGPRYQGRVAMDPLAVRWGRYGPVPVEVDFELGVLRGPHRSGERESDHLAPRWISPAPSRTWRDCTAASLPGAGSRWRT